MNGQDDHPHVPLIPFTPHQQPLSAAADDPTPIPIDIDDNTTPTMPTLEDMQALAAAQAEQLAKASEMIQQQQQQMVDAQATFDAQSQQLRDAAEQMRQQQNTINQLANSFQTLTTATAASTPAATTSRKKPEMPPFDQQNILVWLKRLQAAYERAGVVLPKDKFAYLESIFDISFNPIINDYLFKTNPTNEDWSEFIAYMKMEYGPTIRQKARKLIGDLPRNNMKPSQYLSQLEEEVKDVTLDNVKREHLLKTIPPRIREIMGKAVETKSAAEVAKMADAYFDSQGRPLEKSATSINNINNSQSSTASAAPSATSSLSQQQYTAAFDDGDADINFVNRNKFKARSRSRPRFNNSNSRQNNNSSTSSTAASAATPASNRQPQQQGGNSSMCRFHRMFGDSATRCISNCPRHSAFMKKQQQQGNDKGGRRM